MGMEEAKRLHARLLRRDERRLQPLLLRVCSPPATSATPRSCSSRSLRRLRPSPPLHNCLLHGPRARLRTPPAADAPLLLPRPPPTPPRPALFHLLLSASASSTQFAVCAHALLIKSGHLRPPRAPATRSSPPRLSLSTPRTAS
jgi:hypothetical protein